MDANSRKKPTQLEINDLIAEAVVNAEARRNQAEELLSDEELAAVNGGTSLGIKGNFPIIAGNFPIIAGNFPITLA
jgi:bacteriocin-like protein